MKVSISPKCLNSKQLQTLCVRTSQLLEHTKAPTILRVKNLAHRVKALDYTWLLNTEFKSWIQDGCRRVFKFSISCSGKYWLLLHLFLIWSNLQIGRIKAAHTVIPLNWPWPAKSHHQSSSVKGLRMWLGHRRSIMTHVYLLLYYCASNRTFCKEWQGHSHKTPKTASLWSKHPADCRSLLIVI